MFLVKSSQVMVRFGLSLVFLIFKMDYKKVISNIK